MRIIVWLFPLVLALGCHGKLKQIEITKAPAAEVATSPAAPASQPPVHGQVEYARKQFAGVVWDDSGIYGNLNGQDPPAAVLVRFTMTVNRKSKARQMLLLREELLGLSGHDGARRSAMSSDQFRWLNTMASSQAGSYDNTFWMSWKAFNLDRPPVEGKIMVSVTALAEAPPGADFILDRDSPNLPWKQVRR